MSLSGVARVEPSVPSVAPTMTRSARACWGMREACWARVRPIQVCALYSNLVSSSESVRLTRTRAWIAGLDNAFRRSIP
eukprot:13329254-Alexandrium_andersonii.AAC.1